MKRSEMLQLMCDTDKGYRMCVSSTGDYKKDELNRMDNILKTLEKAGMKPKGYYALACTGEKYDENNVDHEYKLIEYYHAWEPEDG